MILLCINDFFYLDCVDFFFFLKKYLHKSNEREKNAQNEMEHFQFGLKSEGAKADVVFL